MNQLNQKYRYQLINIANGFNRWYAIYNTQIYDTQIDTTQSNLYNKRGIIYTIYCNHQAKGFNLGYNKEPNSKNLAS